MFFEAEGKNLCKPPLTNGKRYLFTSFLGFGKVLGLISHGSVSVKTLSSSVRKYRFFLENEIIFSNTTRLTTKYELYSFKVFCKQVRHIAEWFIEKLFI